MSPPFSMLDYKKLRKIRKKWDLYKKTYNIPIYRLCLDPQKGNQPSKNVLAIFLGFKRFLVHKSILP